MAYGNGKGRPTALKTGEINICELVDYRLNGRSFDDIALFYGTTKMIIYGYYERAAGAEHEYQGYEPIKLNQLIPDLEDDDMSFRMVARKHRLSRRGLMNYIKDRNIDYEISRMRIKEMLDEGLPKKQIAEITGMSYNTFLKRCDELGIELKKGRNDIIDRGVYR